jgi:hypothetical protein
MVPLGVRGLQISVAAMKAARTKATVVKKPKAPWIRFRVLCMVGKGTGALRIGVAQSCYSEKVLFPKAGELLTVVFTMVTTFGISLCGGLKGGQDQL